MEISRAPHDSIKIRLAQNLTRVHHEHSFQLKLGSIQAHKNSVRLDRFELIAQIN